MVDACDWRVQVDEEALERERQRKAEIVRKKEEARQAKLAEQAARLQAIQDAKQAKIDEEARSAQQQLRPCLLLRLCVSVRCSKTRACLVEGLLRCACVRPSDPTVFSLPFANELTRPRTRRCQADRGSQGDVEAGGGGGRGDHGGAGKGKGAGGPAESVRGLARVHAARRDHTGGYHLQSHEGEPVHA